MIFKIKIKPVDKTEEPYMQEFHTDDIKWSMDQYQRNRRAYTWELIDYEETH